MKTFIGILLWCALLLHGAVAADAGTPPSDKAQQWEQAAVNREWAATAKEQQAWGAAAQGDAFRGASYADQDEAHRNLRSAVTKLVVAGDLLAAAAANHDRAAQNWRAAATTWKQAGKTSDAERARARAERATAEATALLKRAAELYESGVEIYADMGELAIGQMAAISEKAAVARERIAAR